MSCTQKEAWQKNVDLFFQALSQSSAILITAPLSGDGDSVGSQLALRRLILSKNPHLTVMIVNHTPCPALYRFLADTQVMMTPEQLDANVSFSMGIVLDGGVDRAGTPAFLFETCPIKVSIDHHAVREDYPYDIDLYDPEVSSTAEMIFRLIEAAPWPVSLTQDLAAQLYLGLIYDTGFFRHSNTHPSTLRLAARLVETGFNFTRVGEQGLLERSGVAQKIMGHVLSQSSLDPSGKVMLGTLSFSDLERFGGTEDDREGIVDQLFLTRGIEVAIFCHEIKPHIVKVSLRSKGAFDVATLARSLGQRSGSSGGGHRKAAGCALFGLLNTVAQDVVDAVQKGLAGEIS